MFFSDVDEALDATDAKRLETFLLHLQRCPNKALYFCHYRYWYDFDNRCYWTNIYTPVARVGRVRQMGHCRLRSRPPICREDVSVREGPLFFEYTFCFPKEDQWKKLQSFIHDGYSKGDLDVALLTNHWVKAPPRGERVGERGHEDWFERVELTPENSPAYVRENLERLKTNVIPVDYREHRMRLYGVASPPRG